MKKRKEILRCCPEIQLINKTSSYLKIVKSTELINFSRCPHPTNELFDFVIPVVVVDTEKKNNRE